MYRIEVTHGAEGDLKEIARRDKEIFGIIVALLEEIDNQDIPPHELLTRYDTSFGNFSVRFCVEIYEQDGLRVWAIKTYWNPEVKANQHREPVEYRILFAPSYAEKQYVILGIFYRKSCYEPTGEKYTRLQADYHRLGCHATKPEDSRT